MESLLERLLNIHPAILPRLSPDGNRLAFIKSDDHASQIWLASANEFSEPRRLTGGAGLAILDWTADSGFIAFAADLKGDERQGFYLVSADGKEQTTLLPPAFSYHIWGGFAPDGKRFAYAANRENTHDFSVYVQSLKTGETTEVYRGSGGFYPVSWQPDGNALLLLRTIAADANEVFRLDLRSGEIEALLAPDEPSYHNFFSWKSDASGFFLATNQAGDFGGLAFFDLNKKQLEWRQTPERDVENAALSPSGKYLAWFENDRGYSRLSIEDMESNSIISPADFPEGVIYEIRWAKETDKLAIELTSPQIAGDIWIYSPASDDLLRATYSENADSQSLDFVFPEMVAFPSHDGELIYALIYLPQKATGSPPAIIHLHGGPTMQARPKFDAFHQYLLKSGFAIVDLNYRGSTGYGKRFMRLDDQLLRKDAVLDLASAVEYLRSRDDIDNSKIALFGESYGGFMVLAGLSNFPDLFVCGVDVVGVADWLTALENTVPQLRASDTAEYGDCRDPKVRGFLRDLSPINHTDKIQTPLLIVHGENDPRVPVTEAKRIAEALTAERKEVDLLILNDEGHGIRLMKNRLLVSKRIAEFMSRYLLQSTSAVK